MKSIIQTEKRCYICDACGYVEEHHIFHGTANRKLSEKHGLKVYLCYMHHRDTVSGVHFNSELDTKLKRIGQQYYEKQHSREEFMREFGKNYLED